MKNQRRATVYGKLFAKQKNAHAKRRTHARLEDYILVEMNGERRKASNKKCPQSSKGLRAVIPVLFAMPPAGGGSIFVFICHMRPLWGRLAYRCASPHHMDGGAKI